MRAEDRPGIHTTVYRQPGGHVPTEATEAVGLPVDRVEGQTVIVRQSRVNQLSGNRVRLEQSRVDHVEARSAQTDRSAIRHLEAERAVTLRGAVAWAQARDVRAVRTRIAFLQADRVTVEDGRVALAVVRELAGPAHLRLPLAAIGTFLAGIVAGLLLGRLRDRDRG